MRHGDRRASSRRGRTWAARAAGAGAPAREYRRHGAQAAAAPRTRLVLSCGDRSTPPGTASLPLRRPDSPRDARTRDERLAVRPPPARGSCSAPSGRLDLSVAFHGRRVPTPYGPAAGPHAQLAQNIALAWLGGARIIELKTVQVRDDLVIPRPCIDMQTVGYNVEWSQELKLEQSLEEYVKASMLVRILAESGSLPMPAGFATPSFDMSVGYDFAGITSGRVQAFLRGMLDASAVVDRLRREIPDGVRAASATSTSPRASPTP